MVVIISKINFVTGQAEDWSTDLLAVLLFEVRAGYSGDRANGNNGPLRPRNVRILCRHPWRARRQRFCSVFVGGRSRAPDDPLMEGLFHHVISRKSHGSNFRFLYFQSWNYLDLVIAMLMSTTSSTNKQMTTASLVSCFTFHSFIFPIK